MIAFPERMNGLILHRDIVELDLEAELRHALIRGEVRRVRHGVYEQVDGDYPHSPAWKREAHEYLARVHAIALVRPGIVFTGVSAVALAGLPIFGRWPREIVIMSADGSTRSRSDTVTVSRPAGVELAIDETDGCATTSIEVSLIQLCRHSTLAGALTAVDAALRRPRARGGSALTTMDRLRRVHEGMLPYRGSGRTEAVLARATDRSDSPLETVNRLAFEQLGFEQPALQVPMYLPELSTWAELDFMWRSVSAAAEADGRGKYLVQGDAQAAVIREKDRENAVRRQLRAFDRWDWRDTIALAPLEARLERMGVPRTMPKAGLIPPEHASVFRLLRPRRLSAPPR